MSMNEMWKNGLYSDLAVYKAGRVYDMAYCEHGKVKGTAFYMISVRTLDMRSCDFGSIPSKQKLSALAKKFLRSKLRLHKVTPHGPHVAYIYVEIKSGTRAVDRSAFLAALIQCL